MNTKLNHNPDWEKLAEKVKWSAAGLAKECGVSVRTLHRHFLKHFGRSTKDWLNEQRQRKASALVLEGLSIKETAGTLGYKHQGNLTRKFKQSFGFCPSQRPSDVGLAGT
ncbi:MAG: hypothetical protein RLZZ350_2451 [Verrucomicrobiota bacterium]|jgi:AraC-like DNA-binding protein